MSNFPRPVNKKSVFDRQRAEAEAKRRREAAETAAIYEDFVKSFGDSGGGGPQGRGGGGMGAARGGRPTLGTGPSSLQPPAPSGSGRRHFSMPTATAPAALARHSGPGSLGPVPPSTSSAAAAAAAAGAAAPGFSSDRRPRARNSRPAFGDDDNSDDDPADGRLHMASNSSSMNSAAAAVAAAPPAAGSLAMTAANRAEERAASKPTVRLSHLPPNMSPAAVRALVASTGLVVDGVQMLQQTATGAGTTASTDRKSAGAIVTLSAASAASDMDAAVSALQNRYLGYGYYLTLHRHLSSALVATGGGAFALSAATASISSHPFGARPVPPTSRLDTAPSASAGGAGFAPPPSLLTRGGGSTAYHRGHAAALPPVQREGLLYVPVRPPRNIQTLRMIHKVVECVLAQGPALEALLMSRPEVQRQERWAWLWDARSEAGVWYRYRLWETVTGHRTRRGHGRYMPLFEGAHAWKIPDDPLPYEFVTTVSEFVSDSEYGHSDSDSDYEAAATAGGGADGGDEDGFLNPIDKARLTHLLARLPTAMARLRKGDIARVTAFAMTHASRGADEIVAMLVANVERPFAFTAAHTGTEQPQPDDSAADPSGAKLVALYAVSDILSSSATSGVRHAWRYRQLFEAALRRRRVFGGLGCLADRLHWGRLRADKWKRSIGLILGLWEGWSVFPAATQEYFVRTFESPPRARQPAAATVDSAKKGRWKTVDAEAARPVEAGVGFRPEAEAADNKGGEDDGDGDGDDGDSDGAYRSEYTDDEELDLACLDEEDIDGRPMSDVDVDGTALTAAEVEALIGRDIMEMSEEGEIGTDDEVLGLTESEEDKEEETEKETEKENKTTETESKPTETRAEPRKEPTTTTIGEFHFHATPVSSRKRMRAVDLFAPDE